MSKYEGRSWVMMMIVAAVALVFLVRLFYIQVIDQDYKQFAEDNALRKQVIYPPRGIIYDRNGKVLVRNETIYDVMAIPSQVKNLDTAEFCRLLNIDPADFKLNFNKARAYSRYKPSPVVRQISVKIYGRFQERMFEYPGFFVQPRTARSYPKAVAGHVLGYLGEVDQKDLEADPYYRMGDYIGKNGIELSYEKQLRGTKGIRHVLVDVLSREQGHYMDGKYDVPAISGMDLHTGIDLDLQLYGEKLMAGKSGSIVAIEPSTGEILAMVSAPMYDPNLLIGRDRAKNYHKLLIDTAKPLFNRPLNAAYPPGSTLKPVEAILAMQEGLITKDYTYHCGGGYRIGSHLIGCHSAGTFDVHNSIRLSCNTYYCNIFKLLIDNSPYGAAAEGLQHWKEGLAKFGLGISTGIDLPHEGKGFVPSPEFYNKFYGERRWKSSTIMSLGIGQAEIGITPLQLAVEAATIANKGYYIAPHFARKLSKQDSVNVLSWPVNESGMDTFYFGVAVRAMRSVVDNGTAGMARIKGMAVCGKTGTAQNPHGKDHALFIGFAPMDTPKIAIAVVVENAGYGGTWAAPIAGLLIEKFINDTITRPHIEKHILDAKYLQVLNNKPTAQKRTSAGTNQLAAKKDE